MVHLRVSTRFLCIFVCCSIFSLVGLGWFMGGNKNEVCNTLSGMLSSDWLKVILSAAVGGITSYIFSNYTAITKANYLRKAMYEEASHALYYVINYFEAVLEEREKKVINLNNDDVLHGPKNIDFSILNELVKESVTSRRPPSPDQRKLTHNIEENIAAIFKLDESRYTNVKGSYQFFIKQDVSLHIASRLCMTIYHLGQFIDKKDLFEFDTPSNEKVVDYVLDKVSLNGVPEDKQLKMRNELINKIDN